MENAGSLPPTSRSLTSFQEYAIRQSCQQFGHTNQSVPQAPARLIKMFTNSDDTTKLEQLSLDDSATINDPGMTSDHRALSTPLKLVRNVNMDTATDYIHIFMKLQLKEEFEEEFFEIMREYRSREDVREALEDPENDLKGISEDFLKTYGKKIWMYKGANNQQDAKFRETFFKWKDDKDT
jgi:hypothetical protein